MYIIYQMKLELKLNDAKYKSSFIPFWREVNQETICAVQFTE